MSVLCTCTAFCGRQIMPEQALKDTLVTQKRTEMTIQKIKSSFIAFVFVFAAVGCEDPSGQNSTGGGGSTDEWGPTGARTEIYTYSNAVNPSRYYYIEVNGQNSLVIPCIDTPAEGQPEYEHNICTFGCDGEVLVEVNSYSEAITEAAILPKSRNYEYKIENGSLFFRMKPGDRVAVELNGKTDNDIFIFANPLESDKPSETDPNVKYYKAGTVTDAGSIALASGQTIYIEGGAVVNGRISSTGTSDIAIRGCGILNSYDNSVSTRGIQITDASNVTIDGPILMNDSGWSTFIIESDNVKINNYKAVAIWNPANNNGNENDALDLLGCTNAVVTGCFGYAHDDVFCVKSQKWTYGAPVENIVFDDCIAWNYRSGNSFIIGAEINQDVTDVTYRNCVSIRSAGNPGGTLNRAGLAVHNCAGSHVSDILFENIVLEDCMEYGIHLDIRKSYVNNLGNGVEYSPGTIDGVILRNIDILKAPARGNFAFGYDEDHQIRNVVFENVIQEGVKITQENLETYFDPSMSYSYSGKTYPNLSYIDISFE